MTTPTGSRSARASRWSSSSGARDAERDGDRIYAVLRAVAGSSDGRARAHGAACRRAAAGHRPGIREGRVSPATVGLVEAHGTGTPAGDRTEVQALRGCSIDAAVTDGTCAIGSVKSMIGHTKCTAGLAGLVKTALRCTAGAAPHDQRQAAVHAHRVRR